MKNTKRLITLKVLTGYIMIGLLVVVAIYFIYPQIKTFIYPPKKEQATNQTNARFSEFNQKILKENSHSPHMT